MVSNTLGQPLHGDNDHLSLLSYRTSIQNSPDWPSVKLFPLCSSVPTLNFDSPNDERDNENVFSLANFLYADSADRSSVITLTSAINSHPSTPRSSHMYSNLLCLDVSTRNYASNPTQTC